MLKPLSCLDMLLKPKFSTNGFIGLYASIIHNAGPVFVIFAVTITIFGENVTLVTVCLATGPVQATS